jgi:large subunit ribosomal protein L1
MPKHGKQYLEAVKSIEPGRLYGPAEGLELARTAAYARFNESIDAHIRLGIDPRHADQTVRSSVVLPYGTGREPRVLVFAAGEAVRIAEEAGADFVGSDDVVQRIKDGWLGFDAAVAMADQMGKVGGLGRILGRRGLMPNPKSGTVVRAPEDLANVIQELKRGRVEFRNDRTGLIHVSIGKKSFETEALTGNLYALIDAIVRAKPAAVKGVYCRSVTVTSTMGPGVPLDVARVLEEAAANAA